MEKEIKLSPCAEAILTYIYKANKKMRGPVDLTNVGIAKAVKYPLELVNKEFKYLTKIGFIASAKHD